MPGWDTAMREPLLDHDRLDLDAARRVTYRVEQTFLYSYDAPVTELRQRLVVVPRQRHGGQVRRAHLLSVTGATARRSSRVDRCGNTVVRFEADHVAHSVEFTLAAVLERSLDRGLPVLPVSALRDPRLLQPTPLTTPDRRLREMAADLTRDGGTPLDLAERVCGAVHAALTYEFGITTVLTTAAQALAEGRGVCQDAAHIMLVLCRLAGLPARYVSGHLLGQGGTHAWVEVVVPWGEDARAVAFDPCHGRRTDSRYVTVAVGRDYTDVAPTSGTYVGGPHGRLTGTRLVGVVAVA